MAMDQYLDKFQPVRMQDQIDNHLNACLHSETRKKHKAYSDKMMMYLMQLVLVDDGEEMAIERLIKEMRDKARKQVEAKERKKRRKQTQVEVTSSIDTKSMALGREKAIAK